MGSNRQRWERAMMEQTNRAESRSVSHQPGQRTKQANSLQVGHAQMVQVGGDPALQDEESPANDAVDPTQCQDMYRVLRTTDRRVVTAACNETS